MLKKLNKIRKEITPSLIPAILPSLSTFAVINASVFSGYIAAQNATIEEVVVTARKKSESLQDVPLSVSALNEETLEERGINVFEDYLLQLPGVTSGGNGPGTSTIYIRGLASTTPNLTVAGVAGLAPNVAFYLDEQPLAQPGRNLDVYAADVARIEVLSGPQGTLFGASSQAGVVRMITNKPKMGVRESNVEVESRFMPEGDTGSKIEFMTNIPIGDKTAWRFVGYSDRKGGYIDQISGALNLEESGRWRPIGTVRANGLPTVLNDYISGGAYASQDNSAVNFIDARAIEKENANSVTYEGFRSSLATEIGDNWNALLTVAEQEIEAEGVFFVDPTLDDLEIRRYSPDSISDKYENMSLTLEGSLGELDVVYAGAYTDRESNQVVDYTDYLFVAQYLPYYICDYSVSYPASTGAVGTCGAPDLYVDSTTNTEVETHEVRINAPINDTVSITAGVFLSDLELTELNLFTYPSSVEYGISYAPNYALTDTSVTGLINDASPGYFSSSPQVLPVVFFNDIKRTDNQKGIFGEANIAISDTSELTIGARWYDIEVDFEGSANSNFYNGSSDVQRFGTNLSAQFAPGNANGYPDKASTDGVIGKVTYSWNPSEDIMYYVTLSEGFRPGLLNRPVGRSNPSGTYTVKPVVESDEVTNYEFGWKTILMDGQLRLNGSAFMVDITGLQSTVFDPAVVNLFFSDNAADAEISGIEGDFMYFTNIDGLSIAGAFSFLDTEITKSKVPTNDIVVGNSLAFAPEIQGNIRVRQEWGMSGGNVGHLQAQLNWSDESDSDIMERNRATQDQYSFINIRAGVTAEDYMVELYVDNVTDERAEISNTFVFDRQRVAVNRPTTIGLRVKKSF